ncbi:MAG TPA: TonB-dependent receptor [bacterium]|nr:TonB-dependent receptor [bacterium]
MREKKNLVALLSAVISVLTLLFTVHCSLVTPAYAVEDRQEEVFNLGEVVITPTRTPRLLGDVSLHTTIITKEEIAKSGARNIGEVIEKETGVKVDSYGALGAQTNVSMRGSSSKQVLILIDGHRMNSPRNGEVDLSEFPMLDAIERVEIVRGPASALYGSGALGGVINIITKEPTKKPTFSYETSYATHNTFINKFSHGARIKKFGYFLSGGQYQSQGHRPNSDWDAYDIFGKLTYDLTDWSKLSYSMGYYNGEHGVPGPEPPGYNPNDPDNRQHKQRVWGDLRWEAKFRKEDRLSIKSYGTDNELRYYEKTVADSIHKDHTYGGEIQHTVKIGERNKVTMGMDIHEDSMNSTSAGKHEQTLQAYWIQDEIKILEPLTLTIGGRWDYHPAFGTEGSPKASLRYKVTKKTTLRASGGRAYRAPTLNDLYWNQPPLYFGNPDLKPEKAWAWDVGIDQIFTKNLLGKLTFFRREVDDLITWEETPPGSWIYIPQNVDKAHIWGLESELRAKMGKYFLGGIGYTWLETRNKTVGPNYNNDLTYTPTHKANVYLEYKTKLGLLARVEEEFVDSRFVNAANTKARELPRYFLTNLRVEYTKKYFTWFAGINNIFDTNYEMREYYPMPRRTGVVGMRVKF